MTIRVTDEKKIASLNDHVCEIGDIVGSTVRVLRNLTGEKPESDLASVAPEGGLTMLELRLDGLECMSRGALRLAQEIVGRIGE